MKNQTVLFAFLFFAKLSISAQEVGTVMFQTSPPIGTTVAKLGDIIVQRSPMVVLPVGTYELTLWAPYYGAVTKTITVLANETVTVQERLEFSQEIQDYHQALSAYNHQAIRQKVLPFAGTGLFVVGSAVAWIRARRFQQQALDFKNDYEQSSSVGAILGYHTSYAEARRKYKNSKVTLFALSGLSAAGGYIIWKGHEKMQAVEKPIMPKQVSPFALTSVGAGFSSFSLTFNF